MTKDVPAYATVAGIPARIIGWACECGQSLSFDNGQARCSVGGKEYRKTGDTGHAVSSVGEYSDGKADDSDFGSLC